MTVQVTQLFAAAQLTGSAATYYTVPAQPAQVVLGNARLRFTNTDTASHTVTAYAIQSGGSASAANAFLNAESIAPNSHLDVDMPVLAASGFLQAFADTNAKVTMFSLGGILFS